MKLETGKIRMILTAITVLLLGLGVYFVFSVTFGLPDVPEGMDETEIFKAHKETTDGIQTSIYYAIFLIAIVIALIVAGVVIMSMGEPKRLIRPLITAGGVAVLGLICYYGLADGEILPEWKEAAEDLTESGSRFIGGGLILSMLLAGIAILAIAGFSIKKLVK